MDEQHKQALENASASVKRMQDFDPSSIARVEDLGKVINFEESVPIAKRLVDLYGRISIDAMGDLSEGQLFVLTDRANGDYNCLDSILQFQAGTSKEHRDELVETLQQTCGPAFEALMPLITYSIVRTTDFKTLENNARASNQKMADDFDRLRKEMESKGKDADSILDAIRQTAAERGVSEQAAFFSNEAEKHGEWADTWRKRVWWAAGILAAYAVLSIFLPLIPPLKEVGTVQLAVSKALVFIVLGYPLFFCARNYAAHRHNAVVNRHRQNALQTYRALVEANKNPENADIVLTQAARFIFAPQGSGYTPGNSSDGDISVLHPVARGIAQGDK